MNKYCTTLEKVEPFIRRVTNKTGDKAIQDMMRSLTGVLFESGVDIEEFISSYDKDEMFNPDCLFTDQVNVFDYINPKYRALSKILFSCRPIGLGTPNAMVGEGEFMCLLLSPRVGISKKKDSGDITVDDRPVEMKGEQVRIMGNITGIELQNRAEFVAKEFDIKPNEVNGGRSAYEPWGRSPAKLSHWQKQFNTIGKNKSIDFLASLFEKPKEIFNECFDNDIYDATKLNKVILKMLFRDMKKKWEVFTIIESNGRITTITSDLDEFEDKVDNNKIVVTADYFRSFQNINIGLYCNHV